MSVIVIYEQVHLADLTFCKEEQCFTFPCPCGDTFTFYIVWMFVRLNSRRICWRETVLRPAPVVRSTLK